MDFYRVSNLDIKMIYISNYNNPDNEWKYELFNNIEFFARNRVKRYKHLNYYDDLAQESMLGLWQAINSYDYERGFDFYRWAQWNISSKIRDLICEKKRNGDAKINIVCDNLVNDINNEEQTNSVFLKEILFNEKILNTRESEIILNNLILGKTLSSSGKKFGITAERARQIRQSALEKIKKMIELELE